ncbi:MAG: pyruvate formate-lyase [Ruminococcaceae bacterium]|jgi:formate C-acetyltransferase|nr:pyruvate formate-lyase [Oscillospiraceae bacterium]
MNQALYDTIVSHRQRELRTVTLPDRASEYAAAGLSPRARMSDRFVRLMDAETPHILPGQKIVFLRTVNRPYDCFTEAEWEEIRSEHFIHELGYISNICPDHSFLLKTGLLAARDFADEYGRADIDALLRLTERYREKALEEGQTDVAEVLAKVPAAPAETFREALQFFRIVHYALWAEGNYHNTVGRFDKWMYPWLKHDLDAGILTEDEAYELLLDFFLSFNIDSDLYNGIQQGDNGQSMMLGGDDGAGGEIRNELTEMCLRASGELKLIDPKINLRVSEKTPLSVYEAGTELTKVGLGFPQYSNDDTVIPALVSLGYDPKDAADYTVAACWEFIIPGLGMEIANIGAISYPLAVDRAFHRDLAHAETFDDFTAAVEREIRAQTEEIMAKVKDVWFVPSPFLDLLYGGRDISRGNKYNNFGIHGTGISCAADSLAAVKTLVFDEKSVTAEDYIKAVDADFDGYDELLHRLRNELPKTGSADPRADRWLVWLTEAFHRSVDGRTNERGGIWRAGTGSAMFYLWHAAEIGASPDGRRKNEPFAANYSPSLFAKIGNPVDIVKSYTAPDLKKVCNGGPLTLEFDAAVFAEPENCRKVASLVRTFILRGGHQLQLNAVSRDALLDAQAHPENHAGLIVRIWGWSAYFVELDRGFQDHVIRRHEYSV